MTRLCPLCSAAIELIPDGVLRSHRCPKLAGVQLEYLDTLAPAAAPPASAHLPRYPKLTEREIQTLMRGRCPDCAHDRFVAGPQGGLAQNIACPKCGAEFSFCATAPTFSHRNSERGKPDSVRLRDVFGIALA